MKKFIIFSLVFGFMLLIVGSIMFGISYKNRSDDRVLTKIIEINESFNDIDINLKTADLELIKSDEAKTKLVIDEKKKVIHTAHVESNKLIVEVKDERRWFEKIFNFDFNLKVTVYLPSTSYENLTVISSTGDVIVPNDFSFTNVKSVMDTGNITLKSNISNLVDVKTSTGNITIENTNSTNVKATASTGNINLVNEEAAELIDVSASTGNVKLTDTKAKDLKVKTSTGDIKLIRYISSNDIYLRASTGNVKFEDSDSNTIDVETSTGSITGVLLTDKTFLTHSDTGKITVPTGTTGGNCKLVTDTGRINIQIKE